MRAGYDGIEASFIGRIYRKGIQSNSKLLLFSSGIHIPVRDTNLSGTITVQVELLKKRLTDICISVHCTIQVSQSWH